MAQVYILRRDGKDYQAPDLETLRRWAQDGRVLPTDMVYSPVYQSWYRAHDLRGLRDVLPRVDAPQPAASAATQQFWLRKGDKNYPADSLETVLKWASAGNIGADDLIFHPAYGKWFRAGDSPQLVSRFPQQADRVGQQMPGALGATAELAARTFATGAAEPAPRLSGAAGPSAPSPSEQADSLAATVMDLRAINPVAPAPQAQPQAQPQPQPQAQPEPIPSLDLSEPEPDFPDGSLSQTPISDPPSAAAPEHELPEQGQPEQGQPEQAEAPEGDAADAEPVSASQEIPRTPLPEQIPDEADEGEAPDVDEDDLRYVDRLQLMKPFYHVARAFVLTRDLRPGEVLEGSCVLPGTTEDFKGCEKQPIYQAMTTYIQRHLDGPLTEAKAQHRPDEMPAYTLLMRRGRSLLAALEAAVESIGQDVPERVVIGNANRPKMSPDENASMLEIDTQLKGVISLKARATGQAA